ncbi:MAG TPA: AmmeMemoRadiSam system protein B [Alkalispirochaeta sp.]|nr:AmmeMemoRadiSam system protein B [Alkalispirochaeta sp.]
MINDMHFVGRWYPNHPAAIDTLFQSQPLDRPQAVTSALPLLGVLPHAALMYTARGQRVFWERAALHREALQEAVDMVVVVAPSHYVPIPPDTTVGAAFSAHATPYGELPGAGSATGAAQETTGLGDREDPATVEREHAVELLLPGIARYLGADIPVAAVLVGGVTSPEHARAVARRLLNRVGDRRVLWLVSSDATHYGRSFRWQPYGPRTWGELRNTLHGDDTALVRSALDGDLAAYWTYLAQESTVCGRYALALAMAAINEQAADGTVARGHSEILDYYSSAEDDERSQQFVCYLTAEVTGGIR